MINSSKRTCSKIEVGASAVNENHQCIPIEYFRDHHAYVLLGAPGSGKTKVFKYEAKKTSSGHYEHARDFITFENKPEWENKVLFIDGLDEVRAGSLDGRTPINKICTKLEKLNFPKFRISCRATDWYGANDRRALNELTQVDTVDVLYLDPLTGDHILDILRQNPRVSSAEEFVKSARKRGVDSLLYNPQSLNFLVKSVNGNHWPDSRVDVFERACKILIAERNNEHKHARTLPLNFNLDCLLNEAGLILAHLVLTGRIGFNLIEEISTTDYIAVNDIQDVDPGSCLRILKSRLFEITSEEHVAPVHMNIADFLAGRYLGMLIDKNGLPVERVLSLITGKDGRIISKFQNLLAWITSFSDSVGFEIVHRGPIGTILYGDFSKFIPDQKIQLIERLREQTRINPWIFITNGFDYRLDTLATPDMANYFQSELKFFNTTKISIEQASFIKVILTMLVSCKNIPNITSELLRFLEKDYYPFVLKELALNAYIKHSDSDPKFIELKQLLDRVNSGMVDDPDDSLLGLLLHKLYPSNIKSSELLKYYHLRKKPSVIGYYHLFWWLYIPKYSKSNQLVQIIDNFNNLVNEPVDESNEDNLSFWKYSVRVYYELINQFLLRHPDEVDPERLLHWIFGVEEYRSYAIGKKEIDIWIFLSNNPNIQNELLNLRINFCEQHHIHVSYKDFKYCMSFSIDRLVGPFPQSHLVELYLDRAITATTKYTARFFIKKVAAYIQSNSNNSDVSKEFVLNRLKNYSNIQDEVFLELDSPKQISYQKKEYENELDSKLKDQKQEWHKIFKPHETALRNNVCPVSILNNLALVYFGQIFDIEGNTPIERLSYLLGDDSLVEATLLGLENSIYRKDVPDTKDFLRISTSNSIHPLTYSILAGLDILAEKQDTIKSTFNNEEYLRKALTLIFVMPTLSKDKLIKLLIPSLECSSNIFIEVLTQVFTLQLTKRNIPIFDLNELVRTVNLDKSSNTFHQKTVKLIVGQVSLSILKSFPVRSRANQTPCLINLLKSACLYGEQEPLAQLINKKLSRKSMHSGQRVYWLAVSLCILGNKYLNELEKYIAVSERRTEHLANIFDSNFWHPSLIKRLKISSLRFYIALFARIYRPINIQPTFSVMNIPNRIHLFIDQLAQKKSIVANHTLEDLSNKPCLEYWHPYLLDTRVLWRENQFKYRDIDEVTKTLQNGPPSSNADLFALIKNKLLEIGNQIRYGNTSDWESYWVLDRKKPIKPQHEDVCRNRLLSTLQEKLRILKVDAQPEGHYADDKRADIRVSYGKMNIPIEIKKSCSIDLWTSIHSQLIPKYTRDPDTDGFGVYLVLWFGSKYCNQQKLMPNINTAEEMRQRLESNLSQTEKEKISVCIIDVSSSR